MTTPTPSFEDWYVLVVSMHNADRNTAIAATRLARPIFLQRDQLATEVVRLRQLCVSLRHRLDGILTPDSSHDPDWGVERKSNEARAD